MKRQNDEFGNPMPFEVVHRCGLCGHAFRMVERLAFSGPGTWQFEGACEHFQDVYGEGRKHAQQQRT